MWETESQGNEFIVLVMDLTHECLSTTVLLFFFPNRSFPQSSTCPAGHLPHPLPQEQDWVFWTWFYRALIQDWAVCSILPMRQERCLVSKEDSLMWERPEWKVILLFPPNISKFRSDTWYSCRQLPRTSEEAKIRASNIRAGRNHVLMTLRGLSQASWKSAWPLEVLLHNSAFPDLATLRKTASH